MNKDSTSREIKNQFVFEGMYKDLDLERTANLRLIQLLAFAPPGSEAEGHIRKLERGYSASVVVYSPFRTFSSESVGLYAQAAVKRALEKLEDELFRWRFGTGGKPGTASVQPSLVARRS